MGNAAQLATSAVDKLMSGFRPSTLRQYHRMWSDFIAFQMAAGLLSYQVNVHLLLGFLEYLNHNGVACSQLQNHLTAIWALHILQGLDTNAFRDERLGLFEKALKMQTPFNPRIMPTWMFHYWNVLLNNVIIWNFQWSSSLCI